MVLQTGTRVHAAPGGNSSLSLSHGYSEIESSADRIAMLKQRRAAIAPMSDRSVYSTNRLW